MSTVEEIATKLGFAYVTLPDAAAGSVESAIRFLVVRLLEGGLLHGQSVDQIVSNVLSRESLGSTALGSGVAVPHTTSSAVDRMIGVFAHCSFPVPWKTPDGQAVRSICLIVAPVNRPVDYLRALEQISQAMRHKGP